MKGTRGSGDQFHILEPCLEFRNAEFKAFVRHLHERRCEKCWAVFAAAGQSTAQVKISALAPKVSAVPATHGHHAPAAQREKSLDRWLIKEYSLIPRPLRPIAGSNDWFRWLDEFRERHAADVAQLTEPLAQRALQVLWNSR